MSKIEYLGKMPDPFRRPDGTRMTAEEWFENRATLREFVVDMEFGGMMVKAPRNIEVYLRHHYPNLRPVLPEEEQINHAPYKLSFNTNNEA